MDDTLLHYYSKQTNVRGCVETAAPFQVVPCDRSHPGQPKSVVSQLGISKPPEMLSSAWRAIPPPPHSAPHVVEFLQSSQTRKAGHLLAFSRSHELSAALDAATHGVPSLKSCLKLDPVTPARLRSFYISDVPNWLCDGSREA